MRLGQLGEACDLAIKRADLILAIEAVERGEFAVTIGPMTMTPFGLRGTGQDLLAQLRASLTACEEGLAALGVEIDDAGTATCLPSCRVEAALRLAKA